MPGTVNVMIDDHVAIVQLQAPQPNFLDIDLLEQLAATYATLDADLACRAVVLCSTGRHFSAGADFGVDGGFVTDRPAAAKRLYAAAARLFDITVPVVAAVQGAAVGAGLGLACSADFRVASASSRFHANFSRLGFHPGFGLSVTLPRIVGRQAAADLLYSGRRIDGDEAGATGLVDRVVDDGQQLEAAVRWAGELAGSAPLVVRAVKRTLRAGDAHAVRAAMAHELDEQTWLWETEDCRIGMEAAAERQTPLFVGR